QIGALAGMAAAEGGQLSHVKPHGALNNQACEDAALADVVARAVRAFDPGLILLAPALSELQAAGQRAGLAVAAEIFADRAYTDAATLVPRGRPGAVLHDADAVVAHVLRMLESGGIVAASGKLLPTAMHSICVHGDTPGAVDNARRLRAALQAAGWQMAGLNEVIAG
nr:LamB/YcsF family protein [Burkholderiaceae bacterium]MCU0966867.1 LamB/YcsF family protein [Burkholderiaceae bacterium]